MARIQVATERVLTQQYRTIQIRINQLELTVRNEFEDNEYARLTNSLAKIKLKMCLKGIQVPE
jgi:hypothetical protein